MLIMILVGVKMIFPHQKQVENMNVNGLENLQCHKHLQKVNSKEHLMHKTMTIHVVEFKLNTNGF